MRDPPLEMHSTRTILEKPKRLLLGPGGVKGFLELGFLLYLERLHYLEEIDRYVGVSIGSIIILLMVVGYNIEEIIAIAAKFRLDFSLNLISLFYGGGIISHQEIRTHLTELVVAKTGKVLTLAQLYQFNDVEVEFVTVKCPFGKYPETIYLSRHTHPDMSIIEAVILSSNLPFIFKKIEIEAAYYLDGALGDPYPINRLDDGKEFTIGLYIQTPFQDNVLGYLNSIVQAPLNVIRDQKILQTSEKCLNVSLESEVTDIIGMSLEDSDRLKMIMQGYKKAEEIFGHLKCT